MMKRALYVLCVLFLAVPLSFAGDGDAAPKAPAPEDRSAQARIEEVKVHLEGSEDPFPAMPFCKPQLNHYAFLKYLRDVASDPDVDAVTLKLDEYGVGWARLLEIREALKAVRQAGKKVFIYKENLSTPDLVLASVADRISVPESGVIELPGIAIEDWYTANAPERAR